MLSMQELNRFFPFRVDLLFCAVGIDGLLVPIYISKQLGIRQIPAYIFNLVGH